VQLRADHEEGLVAHRLPDGLKEASVHVCHSGQEERKKTAQHAQHEGRLRLTVDPELNGGDEKNDANQRRDESA
jgi:hypothetical protein